MAWKLLGLGLFACAAPAAGSASKADLSRAQQRVPRKAWKGDDFAGMSTVLTNHLRRAGHTILPCSNWTASELQALQRRLAGEANPELLSIYDSAEDNRRHRFKEAPALEAHWAAVDAAAAVSEKLKEVRRDGLCHEAVMWWAHHLPLSAQQRFSSEGITLPSLPEKRHTQVETSDAARLVHGEYEQQVSCQQCHTGKISGDLMNATLPSPLPQDKEHPGLERKRVCDFQAQPPCGPCDGLGGLRTGDGVEEMTPMECEVMHGPEVPPTTKGRYPDLAVVNITGDTRFPLAVIPSSPGHYRNITAKLYLGWKDHMMRMRYDFDGLGSQISVQSFEQAKNFDSGATIGLSPDKCSCSASVAGNMHVQSFEAEDPWDPLKLPASKGGAAYLGRVKVRLDGKTSKPDGTAIADHFMKWAFHFLVDADEKSPSFGLPLRLYGPYGVLQVFDGWHLGDPSIARPDVWKLPAGCKVESPACSVFGEADEAAIVV